MAADRNDPELEAYRREVDEAVREAARASAWWDEEWLKFPTLSKDAEGRWR